jgi:hypothetical protein
MTASCKKPQPTPSFGSLNPFRMTPAKDKGKGKSYRLYDFRVRLAFMHLTVSAPFAML